MSLEQLISLVHLYANIETYLCGLCISFLAYYFIRRCIVIYEYKRFREYTLEAVGETMFVSFILAFFWPISVVVFALMFLKIFIDQFIIFVINRLLQKT